MTTPATTPPIPATPTVQEIPIGSFADFAAYVSTAPTKARWFRGARKAGYDLIPSLYRHTEITDLERLKMMEGELMSAFRHRAPPFVRELPRNEFELLFLMQHHGLPTRLLDWTENPYVALFFALETARSEEVGKESDSAVWVLDPAALNKQSLSNHSGTDRVLAADDELLNAYEPKLPFKNSAKLPIGIFGVHNSQRIVAQRGVFVLFGTSTRPMNLEPLISEPDTLIKLVLAGSVKKELFAALFNMGFTDSVVYPDLDGLAREIRYRYGY